MEFSDWLFLCNYCPAAYFWCEFPSFELPLSDLASPPVVVLCHAPFGIMCMPFVYASYIHSSHSRWVATALHGRRRRLAKWLARTHHDVDNEVESLM